MAPRTILAQLVVALKDDASAGAKALAQNLKGLERSAVDFAKTMQGAKWGAAFTRDLGKLKATQDEISKIKASWADLQGQLSGSKNAALRRDAARQWANDWRTNLQAVRIAQAQATQESLADSRRRVAEEKRLAASSAKDQLRAARELAREKEKIAREASASEWAAAQETARAARAAAVEQARAARQAARDARAAQREAVRAEREHGRGAGAIGRSVVRSAGYAIGAGSGGYLAGRGIRGTTRAGGESLRERARDHLAGLDPAESEKLRVLAAEQSSKYNSLTSTSLHNLYRETSMTGVNMGGTQEVAPALAKGMVILQSLKGRDEALSQLTGFMRALDTLGKNVNPADVKSLLDGMTRAAGVQGVEYQPKQIFTMAKQSRSAGGALSNEFLNTIAPSLIADMGPSAPGTALATMMSSVVGGTLSGGNTKQKLLLQQQYGLRQKNGRLTGSDRDMMTQNPHLYAWDRLMPTLEKQGIDTKNEGAVSEAMNRLFTRTVADLFTKLISQKGQYQGTQGKLAKAPGLAAADDLAKRDPFVAAEGVTAQLNNLAAEISRPIIDTINPALTGLAGTLGALSESIRKNPELAKKVGIVGAAGGGVGAAGAGAGALAALWQSKGVSGAISGGMRGGVYGAVAGGVGAYAFPMAIDSFGGVVNRGQEGGRTAYGSALPGAAGDYERSMAAQRERNRDPEAARGRGMMDLGPSIPAPTVDAGAAAANGAAAGEALGSGIANGVAAQAPAVEAQGRSIMDRLRSIFSSGVTLPVQVQSGGGGGTTPAVPARASGGSVAAGGLYRVNEYGEEFFQPTEDGRIVDPRRKAAGGEAGARAVSITSPISITIAGSADPDKIAQEVTRELETNFRALARSAFADYGADLA